MEADTWPNLGRSQLLIVPLGCISNINNRGVSRLAPPQCLGRLTRWTRSGEITSLPGIRNSCALSSSTPQHLNAKLRAGPEKLWAQVEDLKSVPVPWLLRFVPLLLLWLAAAPAPAGIESRGCVGATILDPDIKASFARFDATQSPQAARLCAVFFNNARLVAPR
jgi:hypothetical protein